MSEFRYPLPEFPGESPWDKLSDAARHELSSHESLNTHQDLLSAEAIAIPGLSETCASWAVPQINHVLRECHKIDEETPSDIIELIDQNPALRITIQRLHNQRNSLLDDSETAALAEQMSLVIMPWRKLSWIVDMATKHSAAGDSGVFSEWVAKLRKEQGIMDNGDYLADVNDAIANYSQIYSNGLGIYSKQMPREYLQNKIDKEGPWGVMLIDASQDPRSVLPERYTNKDFLEQFASSNQNQIILKGQPVGSVGIFEWVVASLQLPTLLPIDSSQITWLPATRAESNYVFSLDLSYSHRSIIGGFMDVKSNDIELLGVPRLGIGAP